LLSFHADYYKQEGQVLIDAAHTETREAVDRVKPDELRQIVNIVNELNKLFVGRAMGSLQQERMALKGLTRLPSSKVFSGLTIKPDEGYAFHLGGRSEAQFNVGIEKRCGELFLRHGLAFSIERSKGVTNLDPLKAKARRFNVYAESCPDAFPNLYLWNQHQYTWSADRPWGPIPEDMIIDNSFVMIGKRVPLAVADLEMIAADFDDLLPAYRFVERDGPIKGAEPSPPVFDFTPGLRPRDPNRHVNRATREQDYARRHDPMQEALYERLAAQFGAENVGTEQPSGVGTWIDLAVRHASGHYWFYEIKTANSARGCIREAIGQLLEYAHWKGGPTVDRFVVVGDREIDHATAEYLQVLKRKYKLPIYYERCTLCV
jgi:hypothetical protein